MENSADWRIDVVLGDYSLTASRDQVKVTGLNRAVCCDIVEQFKALAPDVKHALAKTASAIVSSVLLVAFGIPQSEE